MRPLRHLCALAVLLVALAACADTVRVARPEASPTAPPLEMPTATLSLPAVVSPTATTAAATGEGPASGSLTTATPDLGQPLPPPVATTVATTQAVCTYEEARGIAEAFLHAYNRGDQRALAGFFGRKFKWYSATNPDEPHFVAYQPEAALAYFERRHALGERLTLREFHVTGEPREPPRDLVNFWYELDRQFEDRTLRAIGKGAMDCEGREIFVWSMGFPP